MWYADVVWLTVVCTELMCHRLLNKSIWSSLRHLYVCIKLANRCYYTRLMFINYIQNTAHKWAKVRKSVSLNTVEMDSSLRVYNCENKQEIVWKIIHSPCWWNYSTRNYCELGRHLSCGELWRPFRTLFIMGDIAIVTVYMASISSNREVSKSRSPEIYCV